MASVTFPVPPIFTNQELDTNKTGEYLTYITDDEFDSDLTLLTTAGTSQFNLLDDDEIIQLNNIVAGFNKNKIFGLPPCNLSRLRRLARKLPSEIPLILLYPDRFYSVDRLMEYFREAANVIPQKTFYVHAMPIRFGIRGGYWDWDSYAISQLTRIPQCVGIKEESSSLDVANNSLNCSRHMNFKVILAGGSQRRFLALEHTGGIFDFLAGVGSIFPEIDFAFCEFHEIGDYQNMLNITKTVETPVFNVFMKMGWHKAMRGAISKLLFREEDINRKPFPSCRKLEFQIIKEVLDGIDIDRWSVRD